ncbi:hypothetical protein MMC26_007467 [Xylographa opegraphella]|nr:hypothetical protein [Xylographa opegraphella]
MTRPSTPPILSELRSPTSPATQVAALRALKNEVVGHEQRKEKWVGLGVVSPLTRILNTHKGGGKRRHREVNGALDHVDRAQASTDEEARMQAIIIVGSLANGGPAYIPPLSAGSVIPPLLSALCPTESPPQLVLAALRSLNTLADSLCLSCSDADTSEGSLLKELYTEHNLAGLSQILEQTSVTLITQQQICLAAALITKTCKEESQRKILASSGVLDALATRLASFIVATRGPTSALDPQDDINIADISVATTRSRLSSILHAIATIISNSKLRTTRFACASAFGSVFPRSETDPYSWRAPYSRLSKRHPSNNNHENSLPPLPSSQFRDGLAQTLNFPPLGAHGGWGSKQRPSRGFSSALEITPTEVFSGSEEDETPLITWLIHVIRAESDVTRLMASWVLTLLYRAGLANRRREAGLALLLVPLLVRMLASDYQLPMDTPPSYDNSVLHRPEWLIMEHAPTVLAMLVVDSIELQRAAVDAGAIKRLSQLLKQSFDPLPSALASSMWNPTPRLPNGVDSATSSSVSRLGVTGFSPEAYHVLQMRESVLSALASMATFKDEYRKAIIDNGVVPFVIHSLKPHTKEFANVFYDTSATGEKSGAMGNPTPVLLAACGTARALSRSVSTLRTSLVDAGLAVPLYTLLKNSDIEVQVAATAVVCNLVLEFSPMREAIIEAGILKVLCEHAHSLNTKLRLNSVWALKHLVHTASNALKMKCLEELGPGWLKQIICHEAEGLGFSLGHRSGERESSGGTPIAMGTPNAAGEQVDLLNAVEEESTGSSEAGDEEDDEAVHMVDSIGALSKSDTNHRKRVFSANCKSAAHQNATGAESDLEAAAQARMDDILVQEQGLNFIRNLICGQDATEMIDYIFRELGQDKLFEILASKLRPKVVDAFSRDRRSAGNGVKHIPPQQEILTSVCYILVHLAAGSPRHRQLLISQTELLKLVVPLFSHHSAEVRTCCAWIVINLTYTDNQSDKVHCKTRAYELRKLGVYEKLEELESDPELDVRERTNTAIHQMKELLR